MLCRVPWGLVTDHLDLLDRSPCVGMGTASCQGGFPSEMLVGSPPQRHPKGLLPPVGGISATLRLGVEARRERLASG